MNHKYGNVDTVWIDFEAQDDSMVRFTEGISSAVPAQFLNRQF